MERARSAELSQQVDEQAARLASQVERHRAEGAKRDADIIGTPPPLPPSPPSGRVIRFR